MKLRNLIWIVVPLALYGVYTTFGLPHGIWSYSFIDEGQGNSPYAPRTYTRCTFVGPYGGFTLPAENGQCGWVKFFKKEDGHENGRTG